MCHSLRAALTITVTFILNVAALTGCRSHPSNTGPPLPATSTTNPAPGTPVSSPRFVDVADTAGLRYQWRIEGKRPVNILQSIGNGCAFLDYDNDGNLDILLVGSRLGLYRGDGRGHFTDVTRAVHLDTLAGRFLGCAVGDYDNDGWDDIYISGFRTGLLLHNDGGRAFSDVTRAAGLKPQPWGTSCGWADVDGDGRLDLFVANYVRFGPEPGIPQLCNSRGVMGVCPPRAYKPLHGVLFRNLGQGRFTDASSLLNLKSTSGCGLGAAFAPLDESGRPALAIANDETPGDLLSPGGHGKTAHYTNMGLSSGMAYDRDGNVHAGMGTDWGDYDGDGRLDLFVAAFRGETKSLYHNDGRGAFSDASYLSGLATPTIPYVAFGCKWLDYDNDGWLDLMVANGHVQDNIRQVDTSTSYRQITQLFHNRGGARPVFDAVGAAAGAAFRRPILGRGVAVGDYNNDGRMDALVVDSEGQPLLLHNESAPVGHWLCVRLQGTASNRDGLGSLVTATVRGRKLLRLCHTDGSYMSASDRRVHFGLGPETVVDELRIRWPSGQTDTLRHIPCDRVITLREGETAGSDS